MSIRIATRHPADRSASTPPRAIAAWMVALLLLIAWPSRAPALTADELALVVNENIPGSVALAELYAKTRNVPDGRIIRLKLPLWEEITFEQYETSVFPVIRKALRDRGLRDQVKCLVTFYGTPIRVRMREMTDADKAEHAELRQKLKHALLDINKVVTALESSAKQADATFTPDTGQKLEELKARVEKATAVLNAALQKSTDPADRTRLTSTLISSLEQLMGKVTLFERLSPLLTRPNAPAELRAQVEAMRPAVEAAREALDVSYDTRFTPEDRARTLDVVRAHFGLINYADQIVSMREYFETREAQAALDSELAVLWWNYSPRQRWTVNPFYYRNSGSPGPRTLMVARIDGPNEAAARRIIADSIGAEARGLTGRIVIDTRNITKGDPYGVFDQSLRDLADFVRSNTKLDLHFDDNERVISDLRIKETALYCGWYSLRNYTPSMEFVPGAVGYHVASLEMVSLRTESEKGWVRGLLKDGIASTMGAVSEPYLHAFPEADDFFILLMTGRLTLAEVYWRTNMLTSWQVALIGDPLYRPFAVNPPITPEQVPEPLRKALTPIGKPAGQ